MVLRKLTVALLSIGVLLPGLSHALAIRDVKTKSALGEPFRGEIELSDIGDLSEDDIKVSLASAEDFERLGIERVFFLTELHFDVVVQSGRAVIKIASNKRVSEPYLDFIVRISWPNNTRLQEVTAFLDPPVTVSRNEPPAPAVVTRAAPVVTPAVMPPEPALPAYDAVPQVAAVAEVADSGYRIRKHDTLWSVARRLRPSTAVSVPTMMHVLHKANPQAFIANNINMLKDGEVLRVPTLAAIQAAPAQATAQAGTPVAPQASNKPLARQQINATSIPRASLATQQAPRAQLKLVAPTGGQVAAAGVRKLKGEAGTGSGSASGAAASGVGESRPVARASGHNRKLSQELAALENQLKANSQKIAMQNAKLAQLEAQLKARRSAEQAAKHKSADKTALEKKALATMACAVATQSFLSSEAKAADPAPAAKGGGSMAPIAGGVVLVIIIALIFFLKGKGKKPEPARPAAPPAPPPAVARTVEPPAAPAAAPAPVAKPVPVEPKKPVDPLAEAQDYIERERYPQAVGILTKALVQAPDRAELHLKLLEIFAKQQDRQSFDEQMAKLEMLGELEAIVEAEKLKSLFPSAKPAPAEVKGDSIEFEHVAKPATPAAPVETPSLEDLEKDFALSLSQPNMKALDIEIRPDPVPAAPVAEAPAAKGSDLDALLGGGLDFSFDKEQPAVEPPAAPTPVIEPPVAEPQKPGLDFNLADLALDSLEEPPAKATQETGLSLDSLDDFLAEHKADLTPAVEEPVAAPAPAAAPSLDFEQALASFKEETQDPEADLNLAEGFELEEFNLGEAEAPAAQGTGTETGLEALDVDFSISDVDAEIEVEPGFDLEQIKAPIAETNDLSEAAAAFDFDLTKDLPEAELADELDMDFDVTVASDDVVAELDKEFAFLATTDENATRLELARAYVEMGDRSSARDLLEEVVAEGNSNQKTEAQGMLMRMS